MENDKWSDQDMIEFAKVAMKGQYGEYQGCKSTEDKFKRFKELNAKQIDGKSKAILEGLGFERITNLNPNYNNVTYAWRNGGMILFPTFETSGIHKLYFEWTSGRTEIKSVDHLKLLCTLFLSK